MLRRLLMALLVTCLAIPAVAMPVHCLPDRQPMAHHGMDHSGKQQAPVTVAKMHDCIGCIAPVADLSAGFGTTLHGKSLLGSRKTSFRVLTPHAPETPPPRS